MRFFPDRLLVAAATGITALMFTGCGNDSTAVTGATAPLATAPIAETPIPTQKPLPGEPPAEEQPSPYGSGTSGSQVTGTLIDGLQLKDIRWSDHGTYFRIVFDMATPDGEPVLQSPRAEASMVSGGTQIRVILGGVRSISDSPNVTGSDVAIGDSLVVSLKRLPESDDQALVYAINLSRPSTYFLAGVGAPGRIVVDVMKG